MNGKIMTSGDLPTMNANRYPERTAIVYKDRRISYRQLNERVNGLANGLAALGIAKGDRVGILFHNCNEAIESFFATQKIGAVAVPLNFRNNPREVKWSLDHAKCRALIYADNLASIVDPHKHELQSVQMFVRSGQRPQAGELDYEQLIRDASKDEPQVDLCAGDWARFMFTGGTTGASKIAIHTHGGVMASIHGLMAAFNIATPEEVYLNHPPLFHIGGGTLVLAVLAAGGTVVLVDVMDPVEILKLIEREKATFMFLIPPQLYLNILQAPNLGDYDLRTVTRLCAAAGVSTASVMGSLFNAFPNLYKIYSSYGATEISMGCGIEITRDMIREHPERVSTLGREYPFTSIRLIDEQGNDTGPDVPGEVIVRSPGCFAGYFENETATAATLIDGWVHTGDIMCKDAHGYYRFVDRKKDMVKSGGENVFCQEVEAVIYGHPAVAECCVIGVPDPVFGEAVTAVIKLKPGSAPVNAEDIIELCKAQLAGYKKPRYVHFVSDLPKSGVGKIQKYQVREMFSKP